MDKIVRDVVSRTLEELYSRLSERRNVVIDPNVRLFINSLVGESLDLRRNEWEAKTKLDPRRTGAAEDIASNIQTAVRSVTEEAVTYRGADGVQHIPLIAVVEQIHKRWCGIFPLCR